MSIIEILFWCCAAIVFYTYIGYGIVLYVMVRIKESIHKPAQLTINEPLPQVTLLIAAYNEQSVVEMKMENTLQLDYPAERLDIVWVTDGSTDLTVNMLGKYERVEVIHDPVRGGKAAAFNHAMQSISTPLVVFTDANTMLNREAITEIVRLFSDPKVGCVAGEKRVGIESNISAQSAIATTSHSAIATTSPPATDITSPPATTTTSQSATVTIAQTAAPQPDAAVTTQSMTAHSATTTISHSAIATTSHSAIATISHSAIATTSQPATDITSPPATDITSPPATTTTSQSATATIAQTAAPQPDAAVTEGLYWRYESMIKSLDYRLYTAVGAAGELFAIRTPLYEVLPSNTLLDDFMLSMRIAQRGYKIAYCDKAYATERASASMYEEGKRKVRIAAGGLQSIYRLRSLLNITRYGMLSFQYISHRVLRWSVTPVALFAMIPLNILLAIAYAPSPLYATILVLQAIFYGAGIGGWYLSVRGKKSKLFFVPYYFLFMNINVLRGANYLRTHGSSGVWEKAKRG